MKGYRYIEESIVLDLNRDLCVGCGNCVTVCPHRVFALAGGKADVTDRGACMECRACQKNCPVAAIIVNPNEGCGCATLLIKKWIHQLTGINLSASGCC